MFPLQKFRDYIDQNSLLRADQKVLLTVSGGRDSVLLVHLFKLAGYSCGIAHCNFNLRGDESQRDEAFVRMLAATMDMPFYVKHFDTKAYAEEQKISTQMAARTLRYDWFEETRVQENYDFIAVAHHQTDAIETILLNLTRGTGIAGLHGILPKRGFLIRPMLCLSRTEIDEVIEKEHLDFVEDSSNRADHYARNKIRLHVLPQLKAINPNLEQTFEQNIEKFSETEMVLQQVVNTLRSSICKTHQHLTTLSLAEIKALKPQQLLLFELLRPFNFQDPVVRDILSSLDKQSGVSFYSHSHRATIDRGELLISPVETAADQYDLAVHPHDETVVFGKQQLLISHTDNLNFEKVTHKAFVDGDKLMYPLILRCWQDGDRFMPLGMAVFKKLSDYFIDEKVPLPLKAHIPILVNGNGEIIWVVGMRADNRYKVSAGSKKVTIFELKSATIE
ncbi:tRNA lysidine(34) synthetase TilS [Pedobacter immunditicola]|uniref:tRNA lysidine(34) synthetase TilS n=1 Tax=Pedobacter immunditicola TaxID=3133440 RepID=UPI0030A52BB2